MSTRPARLRRIPRTDAMERNSTATHSSKNLPSVSTAIRPNSGVRSIARRDGTQWMKSASSRYDAVDREKYSVTTARRDPYRRRASDDDGARAPAIRPHQSQGQVQPPIAVK